VVADAVAMLRELDVELDAGLDADGW